MKATIACILAAALLALCKANTIYVANLNGASVTPTPVNTQQSGKVTFDVDRNTFTQSSIAYTVELTLYNTVQSVTLRSGVIGDTPPSDNSNVIAYLFGPSNESPTGAIKGTLKRENLMGPCAGKTINDFQDDWLDKNHAYILVTSSKYPNGALRGELTKQS
ncbi:g2501 [Coccomyxa viridis]|uniref:G2501 protein n=1 Tax=Coccomyxa viridis TaxID=1274662 RepID=A0ABP1FR03_9CHLO